MAELIVSYDGAAFNCSVAVMEPSGYLMAPPVEDLSFWDT